MKKLFENWSRACAGATLARVAGAALALALAACSSVPPSSIVKQPTSVRPMLVQSGTPSDGAIYNAGSYRPMFEDRRARHIGDMLTINIAEKTAANKSGASTGNKSGSVSASLPGPLQGRLGSSLALSNSAKFADGDTQANSNAFTGTIGVTVSEVLPNGNLIVVGEKQIAMDKGVEYIRISGMVNPDTIQPGNVVPSSLVADARVEYRTSSQLDRAEIASQMTRFFQSMLPF